MVAWVVRRVETEVSHPCPSWARCVRTSRTVPGLAGACLDLRFLEHPPPRISIHHRYILWSAKAGSNSTAPLHYIVKPRVFTTLDTGFRELPLPAVGCISPIHCYSTLLAPSSLVSTSVRPPGPPAGPGGSGRTVQAILAAPGAFPRSPVAVDHEAGVRAPRDHSVRASGPNPPGTHKPRRNVCDP